MCYASLMQAPLLCGLASFLVAMSLASLLYKKIHQCIISALPMHRQRASSAVQLALLQACQKPFGSLMASASG